MTPFLQARQPVPSMGAGPTTPIEAPARHGDARQAATAVGHEPLALSEATIAKLQRSAEARARDRARRARVVEAHARTIEALLRAMRDLAGSAASTKLANADRRALDYALRAMRHEVDATATRAGVEGSALWTRRAGDADPAADAVLHSHALGVGDSHVRDVAGAIEALEATELALAAVSATRGELILSFRALELEVDAVRAMRANLSAANGRLCDAEARDGISDDVVRSMGVPAYKA